MVIRELGRPGDLGWVVMAHGEIYDREYGWGAGLEGLVARIVADFAQRRDPARDRAWIAEVDGERAGSVFCVDGGDGVAVLRLLLLAPAARGRGLGGALVDRCIEFAHKSGYKGMRLWTNAPLTTARDLYLSRGFHLTAEAPHADFGTELTGQTYELTFTRACCENGHGIS